MRIPVARFTPTVMAAFLAVGCESTHSPVPSVTSSADVPSASAAALATPSLVPRATTSPTVSQTLAPARPPAPASAKLPIVRSALEIEADVLMAPGPSGTLLVSIPTSTGSVLALLDRDGSPRPGWPMAMDESCPILWPLEDGSVRVVCRPLIFEAAEDVRAFAFDADGHPLAGWPVTIGDRVNIAGRMVGDDLVLAVGRFDGVPKVSMQMVATDGTVRQGADVATECCEVWSVAPDGIAYASWGDAESSNDSHITSIGPSGGQAGWPVHLSGRVSAPAPAPNGRIAVTVGSDTRDSGRVLVFERGGIGVAATSGDLPLSVVFPPGSGDSDCGPGWIPMAPIVGEDGTIFVWSELEKTVVALDPSLEIRRGWPFEPSNPLQVRVYQDPRAELSCGSFARPAVGPDSTLYLPIQARSEVVGGSVVAVGTNGRLRSGWPVELKKSGAEFWSVAVGSDGTVFALVIEPESSRTSSATILAIAPDSSVRYATTVIEP